MQTRQAQWQEVAEKAVVAVGLIYWGSVIVAEGGRSIFRVFIDTASGVSAKECMKAARQIRACMDAELISRESYSLEVSSPGLDRQLFTLGQCETYIGKQLSCRLKVMHEHRKRLVGKLISVTDTGIILRVEEDEKEVLWRDIAKVNVIPGGEHE